ncbi:MAG: peptidase, partial [Minicystis sp.]
MIRRSLALTALPALLFAGSLASADEITPLDAYYQATAVKAALPARVASDGVVSSVDPQRGTPTFFWAQRGVPLPASVAGASSERIAGYHLAAHAARWGLTPAALASAKPVLVHDIGRGGIIVVYRQSLGGVEVLRSDMKVLMTRSGELVAISGGLHPAAISAAHQKLGAFSQSYASVVATALGDALGTKVLPGQLIDTKSPRAGYEKIALKAPITVGADTFVLEAPARIKKVYYPMPDTIVPAYYVEIQPGKRGVPDSEMVAYVIAAKDGRVLMRHDLTAADAFQYRVWADPAGKKLYADGPLQDFNPHPTGIPDGSISAFAVPALVSMESFNTAPGGAVDPWLPAGATETKGNNVDAYTDQTDCTVPNNGAPPCTQAAEDLLDGFTPGVDIRGTTTAPGVFDHTYDLAL